MQVAGVEARSSLLWISSEIDFQRLSCRLYFVNRRTLHASAPVGLDVLIEILGIVVVRELFAGANGPLGEDIDALFSYIYFAVGYAGMIDKSGAIARHVAVNHGLFTRPEKVESFVFLHLCLRGGTTRVLDNARAMRYRFSREEAAPCAGSFHCKFQIERLKSARNFLHTRILLTTSSTLNVASCSVYTWKTKQSRN